MRRSSKSLCMRTRGKGVGITKYISKIKKSPFPFYSAKFSCDVLNDHMEGFKWFSLILLVYKLIGMVGSALVNEEHTLRKR